MPADPPIRPPSGLDSLLSESASRIALLAVSKDQNAKVTLMVFGGDSTVPDLAVKMPTTDAAARVVEHEARILVELRRLRLPIFDRTVPRFVQTVEQRGRTASVVTALPGVPMSTRYHDWHHTARESLVRRDFALAASWLQDMHTATAGAVRPVALADRWSAPIRERWSADRDIEWLTDRLAALHEVLHCLTTPRTVVHGDFWCGNILFEGDRVTGVVDWEAGALEDEPLRDLARSHSLTRSISTGTRQPGGGSRDILGCAPARPALVCCVRSTAARGSERWSGTSYPRAWNGSGRHQACGDMC